MLQVEGDLRPAGKPPGFFVGNAMIGPDTDRATKDCMAPHASGSNLNMEADYGDLLRALHDKASHDMDRDQAVRDRSQILVAE